MCSAGLSLAFLFPRGDFFEDFGLVDGDDFGVMIVDSIENDLVGIREESSISLSSMLISPVRIRA